LVVAPSLPAAGILANLHRGLAVHAQAHDGLGLGGVVLLLKVGEDGVGLGQFFWGLAFTTGRSR
jgi:hypothetical protein